MYRRWSPDLAFFSNRSDWRIYAKELNMAKLARQISAAAKKSLEIAMRRGGPGFDYPCNDPNIIECAIWECQKHKKCRKCLTQQFGDKS